jgi:hypothetical protein
MWDGMKREDENIKWEETREVVCVCEGAVGKGIVLGW